MSNTQEPGDAHPREPSPSPTRHAVRARALVAGLGPSVVPMMIHELWSQGMRLDFEGQAGGVDERWAVVGAGMLIIFKAATGGEARRVTLHARIQRCDEQGIDARLVALDDDARTALRSLVAAQPGGVRNERRPPAAPAHAPDMTPDAIAALCLACVRQRLPGVVAAYLDALAATLHGSADSATGSKRANVLVTGFERVRGHMAQAILDAALASVADYLGDKSTTGGRGGTGGLSLLESIDLRATLLVTEAVEDVALRLRASWSDLEQRLAQVVPPDSDGNALAPTVFCHHFRDAIFFDQQLGALRQVDLAAGFSDAFVMSLDKLYRELGALLERHGVSVPAAARAPAKSPPPRR